MGDSDFGDGLIGIRCRHSGDHSTTHVMLWNRVSRRSGAAERAAEYDCPWCGLLRRQDLLMAWPWL